MAEIGATLREARMRQRIDITDMEARTKIRAKYLRALENEEWDLLPGPTYVRSFLRTYADALGIDSKLVVEEYKLRHDPLETGDLHPIRRPSPRERDRRGRRDPVISRGMVVGVVLIGIVVALFLIGEGRDDDEPGTLATVEEQDEGGESPGETREASEGGDGEAEQSRERSRPRVVRLRVEPTGPVWTCLTDARGRILVSGETLEPGQNTRTFRSQRFRLVLGSNAVRLRINGTARSVPPSGEPIGYTITRNGRSDLPPDRRPDCGA
jgi:cytoskeleton protein RodZ